MPAGIRSVEELNDYLTLAEYASALGTGGAFDLIFVPVPSATRKRGRERRKLLLKAAYELLDARPVEDVSFRDIADQADVPEGSAYHFFANRFDLFSALA